MTQVETRNGGFEKASKHMLWNSIVGVALPFVLGYLLLLVQRTNSSFDALLTGGQIHLATSVMILSSLPDTLNGAFKKTKFGFFWQIVWLLSLVIMLGSIVVWSIYASTEHLDRFQHRIAIEGGIWSACIAATLCFMLVWRSDK
jgi:hypothetical protein